MHNPDVYRGEERGLDLALVDENFANGTYNEVVVGHNFFRGVLRRIEVDLYPKIPTGDLYRGYRTSDVTAGVYLPPKTAAVPYIMAELTQRMSTLYTKHEFRDEERVVFAAWSAWMFRDIHPKQDGNGRSTKTVMGWFFPDHRFYGHIDNSWDKAVKAQQKKRLDDVAQISGIEVPDNLLRIHHNSRTEPATNVLEPFYRPTLDGIPRDLTAELILRDIHGTVVNEDRKFAQAGIAPEALEALIDYIKVAPKRPRPPRGVLQRFFPR